MSLLCASATPVSTVFIVSGRQPFAVRSWLVSSSTSASSTDDPAAPLLAPAPGAVPDSVRAGVVRTGVVRAGVVRAGVVRDESLPVGSLPVGSLPAGSPRVGVGRRPTAEREGAAGTARAAGDPAACPVAAAPTLATIIRAIRTGAGVPAALPAVETETRYRPFGRIRVFSDHR